MFLRHSKKYRKPEDQRIPVKKSNGKYVTGRSRKTYANAVVGKSTSELFRMGYTSAEIADMRRKGSSKTNKSRLINFVIVILAAYIAMSAYNGIQENEAEIIVNDYSQKALGYDALIDKGIIYTEHGLMIPLEELRKMLEYAENRVEHGDMESRIFIEGGKKPQITQYCCYSECNPINHTYLAR